MKLLRYFGIAAVCASSQVFADSVVTNVWVGGNSSGGGWATARNWSAGMPASGQVVAFRGGDVVMMNTADFATAKNVAGIDLQGNGTTLYLPQDDTAVNTFPAVSLGDGTVLFTQLNKGTTVKALNGSGTVTNAATAMRILNIGEAGSKVVSDFSGKITGHIGMNNYGFVRLTGTESTTPDHRLVVLRNKDADAGAPLYGVTEVMRFGNYGDEASSIGKPPAATEGSVDIRFSGWLRYIGPGDESTDRYIAVRYLTSGAHAYPNTLDAGPNGGLTFTGMIETTHESENVVGRMVLTGSNSAPCVIAGEWKGSATHVTKRGPGTWRFVDNAKRNFRAGLGVEEGTLQFDSIAETNVVCSLGLATTLQKPYQGAYNAGNNVDYAYLLGGATTNAVFEYTGNIACGSTTRPIALTGKGARFNSNSTSEFASVSLAGVSALADSGLKTLWLGGTNVYSSIGGISDGEGKVGVTKDGKGVWTLFGNQTFSGPLEVREGTLIVARNRIFKWFRFNVRGIKSQVFYVGELGLFNDSGVRQTYGVKGVLPPNFVRNGYLGSNLDFRTLKPGQGAVATSKSIAHYSSAAQSIGGLFDGSDSSYWRSAVQNSANNPTWDDRNKWIPIVVRMPESADEVSSCDIMLHSTSERISEFSIDGSPDGVNWTTGLLEKRSSDLTVTSVSKWTSDGSALDDSVAHIPGDSWKFVGHETNDWHQLESVSGVNVSPGATLKADGYVTLHCLTLDAASGNGTIEGFDFAETGFVDVTNVPSAGSFDVAVALSNLPDGALARLNGWSVRINGRAGNSRVVFDGSKATVTRPGAMVILR